MEINETECKSILSDSELYGVDYSINPYTGCQCGCRYCYAVYMKRFTQHEEDWGEFVDVKTNAPDILERDIQKNEPGPVLLSSVTDPYQPPEKSYGISRDILEILSKTDFPVTVLTKNDLVLRDLDVLKRFDHGKLSVGFTVNFLEEKHRRVWEPRSSPVQDRIDALERVSREGIPTYVHVGPYFEGITDLERIIERTGEHITELQVENLNWRRKGEILETIEKNYAELSERYREIQRDRSSYIHKLRSRVEDMDSRKVPIRLFID